jgi:hypothetical protein
LYKNRTINIQREYFLLILWLSVFQNKTCAFITVNFTLLHCSSNIIRIIK